MGIPIDNFENLKNGIKSIKKEFNPSFFCIVLYTEDHYEFRDYFRDHFVEYNKNSPDVIFFILDKSLNRSWGGIEPHVNQSEIRYACDYFGVEIQDLPAVIAFNDFKSSKYNLFKLGYLERDKVELNKFFNKLFSNRNLQIIPSNDQLPVRTSTIKSSFGGHIVVHEDLKVDAESFGAYINGFSEMLDIKDQEKKNLIKEIQRLKGELAETKAKNKAKLENLKSIEEDIEDIAEKRESLRKEFDEELKHQQNLLLNRHNLNKRIDLDYYGYFNNYEEESKKLISSCLITEEFVLSTQPYGFDYSLCAAGYWKSLEIELNIIIADVLRFLQHLIDRIPSKGNYIKDKTYFIRLPNHNKVYLTKKDESDPLKFKSLMLGALLKIIENYDDNDYKNFIIDAINEMDIKNDRDFKKFIKELEIVINKYRNKYSHTDIMNRQNYEKLKTKLFGINGLFRLVNDLKKEALKLN